MSPEVYRLEDSREYPSELRLDESNPITVWSDMIMHASTVRVQLDAIIYNIEAMNE